MINPFKNKKGLGRGLSSLIGDSDITVTTNKISISSIIPNKFQPRKRFEKESLEELSNSIRERGIIQPLIVRKSEDQDNKYELIAGERRLQASQNAGLHEVPVVILKADNLKSLELAIVENVQRKDLNPIEESQALIRLQNEFGLTQHQVAEAVGKSRSAVTNLMRLASLETPVQQLLQRAEIELGHAKCLLALEGSVQTQAARTVASKKMTVRQTEALIKQLQKPPNTKYANQPVSGDIQNLQQELSDKLGAKVTIQHCTKGSGKLVITYNSVDELDGILDHIK